LQFYQEENNVIRTIALHGPTQSPETKPLQMLAGQNERMAGSVPVWQNVVSFAENLAEGGAKGQTDSSFGFNDIIDIINPLQHIPVVSSLYQSLTGDTIGAVAQIIGGAAFGGPIGGLVSAGMVAYQSATEHKDEADVGILARSNITVADSRENYMPYNC